MVGFMRLWGVYVPTPHWELVTVGSLPELPENSILQRTHVSGIMSITSGKSLAWLG